jgi:hypothetical protein
VQQGQTMLLLLLLLLVCRVPHASYCMLLLLLGRLLVVRCWWGRVCRAWLFNSAVSCSCERTWNCGTILLLLLLLLLLPRLLLMVWWLLHRLKGCA